MGSQIVGNYGLLEVKIISSKEFGLIDNLIIYKGVIGNVEENIFWKSTKINSLSYYTTMHIQVKDSSYFRCKVSINNKEEKIFAETNPIWLLSN